MPKQFQRGIPGPSKVSGYSMVPILSWFSSNNFCL